MLVNGLFGYIYEGDSMNIKKMLCGIACTLAIGVGGTAMAQVETIVPPVVQGAKPEYPRIDV